MLSLNFSWVRYWSELWYQKFNQTYEYPQLEFYHVVYSEEIINGLNLLAHHSGCGCFVQPEMACSSKVFQQPTLQHNFGRSEDLLKPCRTIRRPSTYSSVVLMPYSWLATPSYWDFIYYPRSDLARFLDIEDCNLQLIPGKLARPSQAYDATVTRMLRKLPLSPTL